MPFYADLHIHSKYSIAVSKDMVPEKLDYWARVKGVSVLGTGDITHPVWLSGLKEALEPDGPGVFRLKPALRKAHDAHPALPFIPAATDMRFILTGEISTIYKWEGKVRKVHHVVMLPCFEDAARFQTRLGRIGNILSDGRPILGLDSRDLLEILLEASPEAVLIPAHIWTPWFSAMGDKSGFDSIGECYRDLAGHISAIETGLSSDPAMNWCVSSLDRYSIISNSDAHSPENIGREATIFSCEPDFFSIKAALAGTRGKTPTSDGTAEGDTGGTGVGMTGTLEFFPQEGKYHYDGHRKCGVCLNPEQTLEHKEVCPVCGKRITVGVMHRIIELCDRRDILHAIVTEGEVVPPAGRPSYRSLIPLKEILSELSGVGPKSKKVTETYNGLMAKAGSEFEVLLDMDGDALRSLGGTGLAEAITRMRNREVLIQEGYDGEYGRITVFAPGEDEISGSSGSGLFGSLKTDDPRDINKKQKKPVDLRKMTAGLQERNPEAVMPVRDESRESGCPKKVAFLELLNEEQAAAAESVAKYQLIIAGPGTGKTKTLAHKIAWLIREQGVKASSIAAITFTNKAAEEMKSRIADLLLPRTGAGGGMGSADAAQAAGVLPWISTFHVFGREIAFLIDESLKGRRIIDAGERAVLLENVVGLGKKEADRFSLRIEQAKQKLFNESDMEDPDLRRIFELYRQAMDSFAFLDIDDLIYLPCIWLKDNRIPIGQVRDRYSWIVMDEYQDINTAQYELLKLLSAGADTSLCVIGDPNQAIYGFRGADAECIELFTTENPGTKVFTLSRSYRCAQNILDAAAAVIPNPDTETAEAGIVAAGTSVTRLIGNPAVSPITLTEHQTEKSEAEYIARTIESLCGGMRFFSMDSGMNDAADKRGSFETSPSGVAVLVRTGRQMDVLEKAFRDHALPYVKSGDIPYYMEGRLGEVISALKAAIAGKDTGYWKTVGLKTRKLADFMIREGVTKMEPTPIGGWIREHTEAGLSVNTLVHIEWLVSDMKEAGGAGAWLASLSFKSPADAFSGFGLGRKEAVSLLTIHAAKGMEFDAVFLPGMEDGLFPYTLFDESPAVSRRHSDEEARLFYVAMTRTRNHLFLSHAKKRFIFGREYRLSQSRFVRRIPESLVFKKKEKYTPRELDRQLDLF